MSGGSDVQSWLAVIVLIAGFVFACAAGAVQQDRDHGPRGLYVGGGGGYVVR